MNRKLIFFILLASALPIFKQFLVLKFLFGHEVNIYGWLLSVSGIFVGFSHLGWGDSVGKKIAQDRSRAGLHSYHSDFKISALSIAIVSLTLLPLFLFFNNISATLVLLVSIQVFLLSIFRNNTKVLRALGLNNAFFYQMGLKNIFDILLIFVLFLVFNYINIKLIFLTEVITLVVLIVVLIRRHYFDQILFGIKSNFVDVFSTFLKEYKYPTTLFLTALLSLLIEYFERFSFFYFLSDEDYRVFVFLSLHFSILLSTQALIFNLIFKKVAMLQLRPKAEAMKYIVTIFGVMFGVFAIGFYPGLLILEALHQKFYTAYTYERLALILILLSGVVTVLNVFETYLLLSTRYKAVLYLKILFLVSYTLAISLFYLKNSELSITFVLSLSFGLRFLYLILCAFIFIFKTTFYEEKTAGI